MALILLLAWVEVGRSAVTIPHILGDHMVLQQKRAVPIWGWAAPNESVKVCGSWSDDPVSATADADGKWQVKLQTPDAGGPFQVSIEGDNKIILNDVLIGEVWICSGQSNMEWPVRQANNPKEEIAAAKYPNMRFFTVPNQVAAIPESDCEATWALCQPETTAGFTAVGYHFGRQLHQNLGVPIGLIDATWGGTVAEAWTSKKTLHDLGDFDARLKVLETEEDPAIDHNHPSVLFNGMLNPLIPFALQGAIWYQGESNCGRALQYRTLFPAMIGDWRANWRQGPFPFYYVQIAPYVYGPDVNSAQLREAQMLTLDTPNTGMAVTMDIGNIQDIHPKNKQDVGRRLALWALAKTYERSDIVYSGPIYKSMHPDGNKIEIEFDYACGGLKAGPEGLKDFEIAGSDKKFVAAGAELQGESLVVFSPEVAEPVAVRYAFSNTATASLFNGAGLPASSFRTDDWQWVAKPRIDPAVEALLDKIEARSKALKSIRADMIYRQEQLLLDEVRQLSGWMVYRDKNNVVKFRIHFDERKEWDVADDEPKKSQGYDEDFAFDGQWLTNRNARNKSIQRWEVSKEPKNRDAYRLGKGRFPLPFALAKADVLAEFEVSLVTDEQTEPSPHTHIHLIPLPESSFAKEYLHLDLWVRNNDYLPVKFSYETRKPEIVTCTWSNMEIDQPIKDKRFKLVEAGKDWDVQETPLD
jgi:sialate O-acetylesterase